CGTPVACARAGAMPEVLGEACLYFDPMNIDEMANAIKTIVEEPGLREELRQKGFSQAARYTWEKTVTGLESAFLEVMRN
ncbi:MAG: glycosyltransferase, partial [Verrucomicrobiae bacterium]|nr:glycosyltransferase [Verrucomicrobiae bacterium]